MITILQKHYKKIGRKGGRALLAKRGRAYFVELRKKVNKKAI